MKPGESFTIKTPKAKHIRVIRPGGYTALEITK
jgi:hypothetical protein